MRLLWIVGPFAVALVGCLGAPPSETDPTLFSEGLGTAFANDKPAFDFFVAKGLTAFQAAGIVGNLDQESGVNPNSVQSGGPGRGIAQWSVGGRWDTSSNDNVLAYARSKGQSATSLNLQLEFIWYELTTFGYGYSQLRATTTLRDATIVFQDRYEICGQCESTTRINYAQSVLNAYGSPPLKATYVSQSWPLATTAMTIKCGQKVSANIVFKNTGTRTWDGNTKLGTTMARDRASKFAGTDWLSPSRAAAIRGTVAPNANGTFAFSFHGPTGAACVPGTYHEYFGVVQEGVAWFSDNGQGGPPDNQLEALITLVPADPVPGPDGGAASVDGGDGNRGVDGGTEDGDPGDGDGDGNAPPAPPVGSVQSGCSLAPGPRDAGSLGTLALLIMLCALLTVRGSRKARCR